MSEGKFWARAEGECGQKLNFEHFNTKVISGTAENIIIVTKSDFNTRLLKENTDRN
jgi:hypothetical protein